MALRISQHYHRYLVTDVKERVLVVSPVIGSFGDGEVLSPVEAVALAVLSVNKFNSDNSLSADSTEKCHSICTADLWLADKLPDFATLPQPGRDHIAAAAVDQIDLVKRIDGPPPPPSPGLTVQYSHNWAIPAGGVGEQWVPRAPLADWTNNVREPCYRITAVQGAWTNPDVIYLAKLLVSSTGSDLEYRSLLQSYTVLFYLTFSKMGTCSKAWFKTRLQNIQADIDNNNLDLSRATMETLWHSYMRRVDVTTEFITNIKTYITQHSADFGVRLSNLVNQMDYVGLTGYHLALEMLRDLGPTKLLQLVLNELQGDYANFVAAKDAIAGDHFAAYTKKAQSEIFKATQFPSLVYMAIQLKKKKDKDHDILDYEGAGSSKPKKALQIDGWISAYIDDVIDAKAYADVVLQPDLAARAAAMAAWQ